MARPLALLTATAQQVLRSAHGLAHVQRFDEVGLARHEVARLTHEVALRRPRIGWYLDPSAPDPAVAAVRVGGVLGCISAAASWGIAVPPGSHRTHVSLPTDATRLRRSSDARRRAPAGTDDSVHLHWERRLEPTPGWRVSVVDALLQLSGCVPFDWVVAAIDSARNATQHAPLLAEVDVARLRSALPEHLRQAVDLSDPAAESSGETLIRLGLGRAGVPLRTQAVLAGRFRTDVLVDEWLPVESDGIAFHSGAAVERDRRRDTTLALLGHPPLRFTQRQAKEELDEVVATVVRTWRRGPGRP